MNDSGPLLQGVTIVFTPPPTEMLLLHPVTTPITDKISHQKRQELRNVSQGTSHEDKEGGRTNG